jgi:hypothetical protein
LFWNIGGEIPRTFLEVVGWEEGEDLWNPMGTSHGWSTELVLK